MGPAIGGSVCNIFHFFSLSPLYAKIIFVYAVCGHFYLDVFPGALHLTAEIARNLVGAHQSAAALIVSADGKHARKWFSLSSKYANWDEYRAPAAGVGLHALVVNENRAIRLTQAEIEAHPAWKGFGSEAQNHPPMRGWLAVPLIGQDQHNYGLLQLSDKYNDEEFTEEDENHLEQLAQLTATTLDALRTLYQEGRVGRASE